MGLSRKPYPSRAHDELGKGTEILGEPLGDSTRLVGAGEERPDFLVAPPALARATSAGCAGSSRYARPRGPYYQLSIGASISSASSSRRFGVPLGDPPMIGLAVG